MKDKRIVLGSLFGDEGKGNSVQFLCLEELSKGIVPLVVRFSGGSQCGHRVVYKGMEHICSLLGSGVLVGCPTYLDEQVMIDPISLKNEWELLKAMYNLEPQVYVHPNCRIITPDDIYRNQRNKKTIEDGSCGCGIYECFKRYKEHPIQNSIGKAVLGFPGQYMTKIGGVHHQTKEFKSACKWMRRHCIIRRLDEIDDNFSVGIFEGSQGLLLDMENGFMPHCTPTKVGLNGVPKMYLQDAEVYLVFRSYLTRHGNGYDPISGNVICDTYKNMEEPTNPDDSIQGKFKIGVLDLQLLRDSFMRHRLDNYARLNNVTFNIIVTHMDCVDDDNILVMDNGPITSMNIIEAVRRCQHYINFNNVYLGYGPDSKIKKVL